MRKFQVLSVVRLLGDKYRVTYLLDGKERQVARIDATFGLERAITETGRMLAEMPPRKVPRIGNQGTNETA